ncbi:trypsin-like peptidase domain-containing protein [Myxococcaceae bacterium JPH2]|nr:trypsin-like peptidase domain-containing protein [Myxococcaceae bacterium JPH2]
MVAWPPSSLLALRGPLLVGVACLGILACGHAEPEEPAVCSEEPRAEVSSQWQCGPTLDFTPVNHYEGEFADVVQEREDAVVLIDGRCTGTLIAAEAGPVVLTAGHCAGLGDTTFLVFNFEDDPDGDALMTNGTVIEQSSEPDYALILPDTLPAAIPTPLTTRITEALAIIQHPRGMKKVIAEGRFLGACHRQLYYGDLDTLVGSSGASVLNRQGYVLGVHTDGDCDEKGHGSNRGWSAESIVEASPYLVPGDLADR